MVPFFRDITLYQWVIGPLRLEAAWCPYIQGFDRTYLAVKNWIPRLHCCENSSWQGSTSYTFCRPYAWAFEFWSRECRRYCWPTDMSTF